MNTGEVLTLVHKNVEESMGELSIALERRRVNPKSIKLWVEILTEASKRLWMLAEHLEKVETARESVGSIKRPRAVRAKKDAR